MMPASSNTLLSVQQQNTILAATGQVGRNSRKKSAISSCLTFVEFGISLFCFVVLPDAMIVVGRRRRQQKWLDGLAFIF